MYDIYAVEHPKFANHCSDRSQKHGQVQPLKYVMLTSESHCNPWVSKIFLMVCG